jgi:Family of unknown function (DUF6263)
MKLFFVPALLAISFGAQAQKINNKIRFHAGEQLEVSTQLTATNTMELMGQSMESKVTSGISQHFVVTNASAKNATLEQTVKNIKVDAASGMGQDFHFDSNKPEDLQGEIGKNMEGYLKSKYTLTVDDKGNITSVVNPDSARKNDEAGMLAGMLSQMDFGADAPKAGEASVFKVLPDRDISKGESWVDSSSDESGKKAARYTVQSISDKEVVLEVAEKGTLHTTQQIMGFDTKISSESTSSGTITIDRQTGMLKQKNITIDSQETIEAQGQSIPAKSKRTVVVNVVPQG